MLTIHPSIVEPDGIQWNRRRNQHKTRPFQRQNLHVRVVEPHGTKWNQGRNQSICPHSPSETSSLVSWNRMGPSGTNGGTKAHFRTPQANPPCAGRGTAWNQVEPRAEPRQHSALLKRSLDVGEPHRDRIIILNKSRCGHTGDGSGFSFSIIIGRSWDLQ